MKHQEQLILQLNSDLEDQYKKFDDLNLKYQTDLIDLEEENDLLRQLSEEKIKKMITSNSYSSTLEKPTSKLNFIEKAAVNISPNPVLCDYRLDDLQVRQRNSSLPMPQQSSNRKLVSEWKPSPEYGFPLSRRVVANNQRNNVRIIRTNVKQDKGCVDSIGQTDNRNSQLGISVDRSFQSVDRQVFSNTPCSPNSTFGNFGSPKASVQHHSSFFSKYYKHISEKDDVPPLPTGNRLLG